jgi:hypothetical protein
MTRTLVIVGCGAAKRDSEAPAKDLYTSTYFQKKRAYAETIGDDYQILSAEHGLVPHDFVIKPYETHIDDLDDRELDLLAHDVGMDLINTCVFEEFDEVRVLAGRSYLDPLREREAFATAPATVRFPLQEADCGGIGEQMQWLDERVTAYGEQQRLVTDGGTCSSDTERDIVDATLSVAGTDCEVTSARLVDCDDRRLSIRLTEDGLREFITELRLEEFDADAAAWLADHSTADLGGLKGGESDD